MNNEYWKKYYKNKERQKPSPFFEFCRDKIEVTDDVLDVGAGDFRDTFGINKVARGVCAVEPNNKIDWPKLEFVRYDSIEEVTDKVDIIYARWFLHAVDLKTENELIDLAVSSKAKMFLEFRTDEDKPDDTHKRRLINPARFQDKLIKKGFKINQIKIGNGFSKTKDSDPHLCRLVCEYQ